MVCSIPRPNGLGHTSRAAVTDSNWKARLVPAQHSVRRTDGSIDFDFYRALATEERRSALNQAITVLWNRRWPIFRALSTCSSSSLPSHQAHTPLVSGRR
jgi:hypothetical protein